MTKPNPEVEARAAQRLAHDEASMATNRRRSVTLREAGRAFWSHPSPFLLSTSFIVALTARVILGGGSWWEMLIPVGLVAAFPVIEWVVHVVVLHWKPRRLGPVTIDPLVSRYHRNHHADPRDLPLVFIPWPVLLWLIPALAVIAWLATPTLAAMLTAASAAYAIGFGYEWTHYLIHSDYRPKSRSYRAIWRNHRLHHYKNEHYWFTVTTAGTADRLFGTYPDSGDVPTSLTVKALHAAAE